MPQEHPPLTSYQRGDRVIITCIRHPYVGLEAEVRRRYDGDDIRVGAVGGAWSDTFANSTSLSPAVNMSKRPISPIFYTIKEPQHVMG